MTLQRLKVHRFRNVRPGTELAFSEHMNVLLGRNGTGKTTLLDLISVVLRSDFSQLRGEEFDLEYGYQHPHGTATVHLRNEANEAAAPREGRRAFHASLAVSMTLSRLDPAQTFELVVESRALRWRVNDRPWSSNAPVDLLAEGELRALIRLVGPVDAPTHEAYGLLIDLFSDRSDAWRFDESLATYEAITDVAPIRRSAGLPLPIVAEVNYQPIDPPAERATRSWFMPFDGTIERPDHGQAAARVGLSRTPLALFADVAGLSGMTMSVAVRRSRREDDGEWWRFEQAAFQFTLPDGTTFSHEGLSYGQKRLLAFLYYLSANHTYVIADELVNGMHHDWIRFCLDEIQTRQCFLTSQNPLLLDYIPLSSPEEIRKTFIQCRAELVDGRTRFVWANLAADDAEEIFKDRGVGVQQVGEILRVRGLW